MLKKGIFIKLQYTAGFASLASSLFFNIYQAFMIVKK